MHESTAADKPNIVFVLVDDLGYSDSWLSQPSHQTSAKEDLTLGQHYVFKYCSPSQVSFLTGRWPHHAHLKNICQLIVVLMVS